MPNPNAVVGTYHHKSVRLRCPVYQWPCPECGAVNVTPLGQQTCEQPITSDSYCGKTVDVGMARLNTVVEE